MGNHDGKTVLIRQGSTNLVYMSSMVLMPSVLLLRLYFKYIRLKSFFNLMILGELNFIDI